MKIATLNEILSSAKPVIFTLRVAEEGEWEATTGLGYLLLYTGEHNIEEDWFKIKPISGDLYWLAGDNDKVHNFIEGNDENLPLVPTSVTNSISSWSTGSYVVFSEEDVKTFIGNITRTFQLVLNGSI